MPTIRKILIANRGEIALRVIRTATDLGIPTVAVYADQDVEAPFVRAADEAWSLGGTTAATTYGDSARLLEVLRRSGADAVHPGYGFLSENADFARAVAAAGAVWLGPSGEAIEALGDKISARQVAESCGVPPVPGISAPAEARETIERFVEDHGYPIVLKKADGGGGRGITVVRAPADLDRFWARRSAAADRGAPCFVERFVEVARHIETQCARDSRGGFRVVSTRDCTVQRRNQKLIEEAPAPFLPAGADAMLTEWSRRLLDGVDYVGVGTCEFLLEPDGALWFLEVNPRLQVEHPVSEEVAGVDLVAEQIRIAEGLPLSAAQSPRGHSLEFRITAEDPAHGLTPATGRTDHVHWPTGPGVRLELGVDGGDEVQTAFDSLLAKIVVTGADRAQSLARARRVLAEFALEGVATPVPVYRDILDDPEFTGEGPDGFTVSTRWLETRFLPAHDYGHADDGAPPSSTPAPPHPRHRFTIEVDGRRVTLTLPDGLVPGGSGPSAASRPAQPLRSGRPGSRAPRPGTADMSGDGTLVAPMQAIVVHTAVTVGTVVDEGDLLVVLEAMKMEKHVVAPRSGVVADLLVALGDSVSPGDPLVRVDSGGRPTPDTHVPADKEQS